MTQPLITPVPDQQIQRWAYGDSSVDNPGTWRFSDLPEEDRIGPNGVDAAMGIIDRLVARNDWRGRTCRNFFGENCPSGESLSDVHDKAIVWFYEHPNVANSWAGSILNDRNLGVSTKLINFKSRWATAASIIHEYIHMCGNGSHEDGDDAKGDCGLPNI